MNAFVPIFLPRASTQVPLSEFLFTVGLAIMTIAFCLGATWQLVMGQDDRPPITVVSLLFFPFWIGFFVGKILWFQVKK